MNDIITNYLNSEMTEFDAVMLMKDHLISLGINSDLALEIGKDIIKPLFKINHPI